MADSCVLLDLKAFDQFIGEKEKLIQEYDDINTEYDSIVGRLLENWRGKGAEAFRSDATKIRSNIVGIYDTLKTMCDTLTDCKAVFEECDRKLGEYNRNGGA